MQLLAVCGFAVLAVQDLWRETLRMQMARHALEIFKAGHLTAHLLQELQKLEARGHPVNPARPPGKYGTRFVRRSKLMWNEFQEGAILFASCSRFSRRRSQGDPFSRMRY